MDGGRGGRYSVSWNVDVLGEDREPVRRDLLPQLDEVVPSERPPMPRLDALPGAKLALAYNVFSAQLNIAVSFAVEEAPTLGDDAWVEPFRAELEKAWRKLRWSLPAGVKRITLGDDDSEEFVPAAVLAMPRLTVAGIAKVILPATVTRNDKKASKKALQLLDGTPPSYGENLRELPAFEALDWLGRGWARLEFDVAKSAIVATLSFEVTRTPSEADCDELRRAAYNALYSGWGMNIEWDLPSDDDYSVTVDDPTTVTFSPI